MTETLCRESNLKRKCIEDCSLIYSNLRVANDFTTANVL